MRIWIWMKNELIIIAGPTGVGKTKLGLWLAKKLDTEIVSADSRQIYKEMRIGTAVPSAEELASVQHHFIQSVSIREYYNASIYEHQVLDRLKGLFNHRNYVILLGGSGLYIDAVRNGIDDLPGVDMKVRNGLRLRMENEGLESLVAELREKDRSSYDRIDLKNPKRVLKALEITTMTGKPYSEFLTRPVRNRFFSSRLIALNLPREDLYSRINQRCVEMMEAGWVKEAEELYPFRNLTALNTLGYKELFACLEGLYTPDQAVERIQANTRKYARKQITWFRKEKEYKWFEPGNREEIVKYILNGESY